MALTSAHESNLVLGKEQGLQIHIDAQKIRLGSADANEALAIASKVREELERIKSAFHGHTHAPPGGAIKPDNVITISSEIAAKSVVAL